MAVLVARADGNLTAAATWGVVDATALLDSEVGNTVLTTAYVETAGFTPGAIEVDAIAVKVASRAASPSGTISVRLAQGGATVAGTEVTINVSDITDRAGEQGWYLFKFAVPVTLAAATEYTLSAKTSVVSQVNLYRNSTAGNWSRLVRTTSTAAPAAGDSFHVLGEWTAAGVKTDRTVTMDETATTDYGNGNAITTSNPANVTIGKGGILSYGVAAATAYVLRVSSSVIVWQGGILSIGSAVTQIPRDSSAILEFDVTGADGDFGLEVYGTFNSAGLSRTIDKDEIWCLLNTDEAAGQTSLGVDTDTGWLSGDEIAIASTTRTPSQLETRVLNGDAGASSLEVTVGLTNAHSGTSPSQAEVILLTRNVKVRSTSSTLMAYVHAEVASTVNCSWTEFRYLGANLTDKRGIELNTTSAGSFSVSYCSLRDFDRGGLYVVGATADNFTFSNITIHNCGNNTTQSIGIAAATSGTNWSITDVVIIGGGRGVYLLDLGGTLQQIRVSSCNEHGIVLTEAGVINKAFSNFECHSNTSGGLYVLGCYGGRIDDVQLWRNAGTANGGIYLGIVHDLTIDGGQVFGNSSGNIILDGSTRILGKFHLRNLTVAGDSSFATQDGLLYPPNALGIEKVILENCVFGEASGIFVAHSASDIDFNAAGTGRYVDLTLRNTKLASSTEFDNKTLLAGRSVIRHQRVDQATGVHKTEYPMLGVVSLDTGTFRSASPSEGMAPGGASAGLRLRSSIKRVPVASGATVAVSVYVRKDSSYNGNAARLVLLSNAAVGIDDDLVLATHSAAADTWQQLSGSSTPVAEEDGVLEFVVECDGTAGNVFVDDWSAA